MDPVALVGLPGPLFYNHKKGRDNMKLDINDFHPELRGVMNEEFARLHKHYPIFMGSLQVRVSDHSICMCGQCPPELDRRAMKNAYATTSLSPIGDCAITFNEKFFGHDGNLKKLNTLLQTDSGGFTRPGYIAAHEWGHVFEHATMLHFDVDNPTIITSYDAIIAEAEKVPEIIGLMIQTGMKIPPYIKHDDGNYSGLPSTYAYKDGTEFFAEAFAAMHWGDVDQQALPCVHRMREFVSTVYSELKKGAS